MHAIVTLLRQRGLRRNDHELQSDPGTPGHLLLARVAGGYELKLAQDDALLAPILPILYDAQLVTLHGNNMLFRGYERGADGAGYVQEWRARVAGAAPSR